MGVSVKSFRFLFFSFLAATNLLFSAQKELIRSSDPVAGEYLVVFHPSVSDADGLRAGLEKAHNVRSTHVYKTAIKGFSFHGSETAARALTANPNVRWVQEATKMYAGASGVQYYPPWNLDRIDQLDRPLSGTFTYKYSGVGVIAYVIDSGINPTAEIASWRIREDSRNFVSNEPSTATADTNGHGSAVAAILGGTNSGVAKDVTFVNYRVLRSNNTWASTGDVAAAIDAMTAYHQAHPSELAVANLSLYTWLGTDDTLDTAVRNAVNAGITVVTIAGNIRDGSPSTDACTISPAHLGNPTQWPENPNQRSVITVASSTDMDKMATDSKGGSCVDVFAPGSGVLLTRDGSTWEYWSGTSMAAPHVAGVAAIKMEALQTDSPSTIEASIIDNATPNRLSNLIPNSPNLLVYMFNLRPRVCCTY
jgi:subtilisin family serine protease